MTSSADLAEAMKSVLDSSGDLLRLKAQLNEEMVDAFFQRKTLEEGGSESSLTMKMCKPAMPPEIILANNLIRQYMEYAGLKKTSAVLCTESGMPDKPVPDGVLKSAFPTFKNSQERPLLISIVRKILKPAER